MKNVSLKLVFKRPAEETLCTCTDHVKTCLKVHMVRGSVLVATGSGDGSEAENIYHR